MVMMFFLFGEFTRREKRERKRRRRRGLSASLAEAGEREKEEEEGSLSLPFFVPFLPEFPSSFFYFFSLAARFISREKKGNGKAAYSFLSLPSRGEREQRSQQN